METIKESWSGAVHRFDTKGEPVSVEHYGCGHIHETYLVVTDTGKRYILQRMNETVFKNIEGLMANISGICSYLEGKTEDKRGAMKLIPTKDGKTYYRDETGPYRMYAFVEDSICEQELSSKEDFYESAVAFGSFQELLKDYPAGELCETIPHFHDTPDRYRKFKETMERDPVKRASACGDEIAFFLERESQAGILTGMLAKGELPLRVTHNDTKLNNVMLDEKTRKAVCVIDLDTTMPGLSCYDFGDSIRFGAATAAEDEKDPSKMKLDINMYEAFARGYLEACKGLTDKEIEVLPLGAKIMTLENGVRFLTDYLDGDNYFHTAYPEHNLVRARTQIAMVRDMEAKWELMNDIIKKLSGR